MKLPCFLIVSLLVVGTVAYPYRQWLPSNTNGLQVRDRGSSYSKSMTSLKKFKLSASTNQHTFTTKNKVEITLESATNLFPLWVLSASVLGNLLPSLFLWFSPFITPALAITMMTMGMTLTFDDFKRVAANPEFVLIGFVAQYLIMPLSASFISKAFQLTPELSSGKS